MITAVLTATTASTTILCVLLLAVATIERRRRQQLEAATIRLAQAVATQVEQTTQAALDTIEAREREEHRP